MFFLRKSKLERLPVVMCGVRMGEHALQVGLDEPTLAGAIATKVGLSGQSVIAVSDAQAEADARAAASKAGALVDLHVTSFHAMPFASESFDIVVVHSKRGLLSSLDATARAATLRECHRVLRPGSRIVIIEAGAGGGLGALLRPPRTATDYEAAGGAMASLVTAGFGIARVLAEREGYKFTEGLKSRVQ